MSAPPPPPKGGGMSLYANLLNPKADASSASISGAPVLYDKDNANAAKKDAANTALRFQPIRRPQINQKKPSKPAGFPKAIPPPSNSNPTTANSPPKESNDSTNTAPAAPPPPTTSSNTPPPGQQPAPPASRTTLADWAADEDDSYLWGAGDNNNKRQRGGRRAKKKRQQQAANQNNRETDWDEIYDPARPTNVDEYLRSDERIREVQEWKAVLYAHRRRDRRGRYGGGDDDEEDVSEEDSEVEGRSGLGNRFAPPADYSFAPPPVSPPPPKASPAAPVPDDATGDDAYARRLAMSGMGAAAAAAAAPPPPPPTNNAPPPPRPAAEETGGATISRGPVRYAAPPQSSNVPPPPSETMDLDQDNEDDEDEEVNVDNIILPPNTTTDDTTTNEEEARSSRPGQAGFAQRLMSKYGWTAGSGLGASSSGILNPLQVKVEKRRRRPDAEGGGFAEPGGRGKVIAPKTSSQPTTSSSTQSNSATTDSKYGPMSPVVLLSNMLTNMPPAELAHEIAEGGLLQEIGQECGDKYGRVERLYIDQEDKQVFIKFTDTVSALRAVNSLEGRVFNGNVIAPRFWDEEKFERGEYT